MSVRGSCTCVAVTGRSATVDLEALPDETRTPGWLREAIWARALAVRDPDGTTTWRTHRRHGWTIRLAPPRRDLADVPDPGPPRLPLALGNLPQRQPRPA